jgi:hypothetical protein
MAHATERSAELGAQLITRLSSDRGTTLIETTIASGILLVVMAGLLSMAALATTYTENHGHLEARTAEYAQDKMEQILALAYGDEVTDTVVFPAVVTGVGTGLLVGGSTNTAAPVAGYVDWLAQDGSLLGGGAAPPATWFYERVWQVSCETLPAIPCSDASPTTGVKQITITATVRTSVGHALIPKSTVVALKAAQF